MSNQNPNATFTLTDGREIVLELYPEIAPNTVRNFISLAQKGYYDNLTFHRIIKGFMIQGGCPQGTGTGGPGYHIKGEFKANGFDNTLKHSKGVISMARAMDPNSAGSQFFIMHENSPHLDGQYAAFGQVIAGQEVVDAIACTATNFRDQPNEPIVIKTITIDTKGEKFEEPEKVGE